MKKMKQWRILLLTVCVGFFTIIGSGCGKEEKEIKEPPKEVLQPEDASDKSSELNNDKDYTIDMYNNDAATTILGYLSDSKMRFPTYTYEEDGGYVEQNIRGNYSRDDEEEIKDVYTGELYLFHDGELRLYFKDMEDVDITATRIGYFTEDISGLVEATYEENRDDDWGVDVYFLIRI